MFSQMFLIILTKNVAKMFFIKQFNKKNAAKMFFIKQFNKKKMLRKRFLLSNLIKKYFATFFNYFNRKCCENVFY
jgi:hypothetical protein